jgi:RNA polymerase primary sigma factor/RNA polymerase sigma factor
VVEYLRVFRHVGFFVFGDSGLSQPGGGTAMHTDYLTPAIRQLRDQQVRFAPHEKQIQQADSAEKLLNELDPKRTYTCKYVCHRVTNDGHGSDPELKFTGKEARHDLRLFVDDLSDAARVPASAVGERVLTIDELARQFRVSTKTISRWCQRGLVSRRFLFGTRKRVGFLQSSVNRFVAHNEERVRRAAQFNQLTDEGRAQIIERVRRLAQAGGSPAKVTRQVAQETGRSMETVRYTLAHFDLDHPDMAIFPHNHGLPKTEAKREVYRRYCRGDSVQALAQRFYWPPSRIYRIVNEMRAAQIMGLPLDYIGNEQFARLGAEKKEAEILGPLLMESDLPAKKPRLPNGLPAYLTSLYEVPLLTREQEAHLFREMNYLKYKASALRTQLDLNQPKSRLMEQIEKLYDESVATKNQIIRANLRLVVSIVKRYVGPAADFFELVSDGNMSLMRAVGKFDFARGFRFSTYATWAITKNFARAIPGVLRHRSRFCTSHSEMLLTTEDPRADQYEQESAQIRRESHVEGILKRLDERERQIVTSRFGLTRGQERLTLKQVGAAMGITKERVRQIQSRAMGILRKAAEQGRVEYSV